MEVQDENAKLIRNVRRIYGVQKEIFWGSCNFCSQFGTCVGLAKNEQGDHADVICILFIWINTLQCNLMSYIQPVQILTGKCYMQNLNPES